MADSKGGVESTEERLEALEGAMARIETRLTALADAQREMAASLFTIAERVAGAPNAAPENAVAPVDPIVELVRAVAAAPNDVRPYNELGGRLIAAGRHAEAERLLNQAILVDANVPLAHTQLGIALRGLGRHDEAIASFKKALGIDHRSPARRHLADLLVHLGRADEAFEQWEEARRSAPSDPIPTRDAMFFALRNNRLDKATYFAREHAVHTASTRYWPVRRSDDPPFVSPAKQNLKAPKLRHDIEQLVYLRENGIIGAEFDPILDGYRNALERVGPLGDVAQVALNESERASIGHVFNRIIHVTPAPRVARALSGDFDMKAIESEYIDNPPGIIAVDNLLSKEALESLRRFLLESTIWTIMRYQNGYLGSFLHEGFNAPLLTQIAEELRAAMPRVIGKRNLQNMWGFKYDQEMSGINLHADPAAVNVNFWLTPDDANLDPSSGGLIVYDVEAPQDWGFDNYNGGHSKAEIQAFLEKVKAKPVTFAYKQNRAVIFNSDLFHQTAPFKFKPGYANRRLNVTMLYGMRNDQRLDASR